MRRLIGQYVMDGVITPKEAEELYKLLDSGDFLSIYEVIEGK